MKLEPSEYLRERGVSDETQVAFGCGLCNRGFLRGYCAFPLFRHPRQADDETPCGYIGRWPGEDFDPDKDRPRYKLPANFEKSRFLFGIAEALALDAEVMAVVEGPITACLLHQRGIAAVSCLGSSLSDERAGLLIATAKRIALCFDADEAGLAHTFFAKSQLSPFQIGT